MYSCRAAAETSVSSSTGVAWSPRWPLPGSPREPAKSRAVSFAPKRCVSSALYNLLLVAGKLFIAATNAIAAPAEMRVSPLPKRRKDRIRFG